MLIGHRVKSLQTIIADFEAWVHNPPIALQEIFNVQKTQPDEMLETVERLFIKPSLLIR